MLHVIHPGLFTTVQDEGRPGHAYLGVPPSGALDRGSFHLANRLVGNPSGAAVLETTVRGPELRSEASSVLTLAVTGAPAPVLVDGRPAPFDAAFRVLPGQTVQVGAVTAGLRSYLAVSGGLDLPPVLGSRSGDVLSGLGPAPLEAGATLPVGPAGLVPVVDYVCPPGVFAEPVLDVVPGPRAGWFTDAALGVLARTAWRVSPTSNRVGLRLEGAMLERLKKGELPSEGTATGSIQVPGNGLPVLFLRDHPVTGGYPVIGVVTRAALDLAAQAAPGTTLRFRVRGR
ncbi:biotin-dependent carboxyltransferase family protein [Kineosporia sp. J2-2]|uniref:Biotin-dependent carboxyltransferase family protein n=1 Tax=Kineosporia corallincola TaxID=2835133 RepID=A0ABS5TQN5_9ACTN|nr:biotin-dependent carboxyltransferase family protein [Kineosporia corallincola]MBT0772601.1 biotin-dependent carboxyltransferase family protein [Kineosporia corallincola]